MIRPNPRRWALGALHIHRFGGAAAFVLAEVIGNPLPFPQGIEPVPRDVGPVEEKVGSSLRRPIGEEKPEPTIAHQFLNGAFGH